MPHVHHVFEKQCHAKWDKTISPILEVGPGDTIVFETPDAVDNQIERKSSAEVLLDLDFDRIHQINGPVYVKGAEPGDTLVIDIIDIEPRDWGWTAIIPDFGLLQEDDDFQQPYVHFWDLTSGSYAEFKPGVRVPFEPFCGVMGVAPTDDEPLTTLPPRRNGGNVDVKQAQPGSKVSLPVLVEGALFSLGDVHAAQGDGEVCGSAIECRSVVTARLDILKGHELPELVIEMDGKMTGSWNSDGWMVTSGHGPDLMESARDAVRHMIVYLERTHSLSPQEAYVLCSACVDLKIGEIVDAPNWVVTASLPLGIFGSNR